VTASVTLRGILMRLIFDISATSVYSIFYRSIWIGTVFVFI